MPRPDDIIGYSFQCDTYCSACIINAMPTGEGEPFDGWALAKGVKMSAEENLAEIAETFGIDRMDERSFDSMDFPKVIFRDMIEEGEFCGLCGETL